MYQDDSFFTLTQFGQVGLVSLSLILTVVVVVVLWRLTADRYGIVRHWVVRLLVALVTFYVFEWLSPQIYYLYYIFLLDVPWQMVIGVPPSPGSVLKLLAFGDNANLSYHARGLLGWLLIGLALIRDRVVLFP